MKDYIILTTHSFPKQTRRFLNNTVNQQCATCVLYRIFNQDNLQHHTQFVSTSFVINDCLHYSSISSVKYAACIVNNLVHHQLCHKSIAKHDHIIMPPPRFFSSSSLLLTSRGVDDTMMSVCPCVVWTVV